MQAVLEMSEYNRFSKESSAGLDSVQNGCSTIILSALPENQVVHVGCLNIRWRNYRIFSGTALTGFGSGCTVLRAFLYYDRSDRSKDAGLGRSGIRLAVTCLYYFPGQRSTASLYRNCGEYLSKTYLETKKRPILF